MCVWNGISTKMCNSLFQTKSHGICMFSVCIFLNACICMFECSDVHIRWNTCLCCFHTYTVYMYEKLTRKWIHTTTCLSCTNEHMSQEVNSIAYACAYVCTCESSQRVNESWRSLPAQSIPNLNTHTLPVALKL